MDTVENLNDGGQYWVNAVLLQLVGGGDEDEEIDSVFIVTMRLGDG